MSGGSAVEHIDAVDAYARILYVRAKQSGDLFFDVAAAIRQLHLALRHLRVEAADPDSLLNLSRPNASVYARQLQPAVEDCDFTLKQLETLLDRFGEGRPASDDEARGRVAVIRSKLLNEKTNIDLFLDTVQLRNPANKPDHVVDRNQSGLEGIKDKVDEIASRIFQRRDIGDLSEDEDNLWQEFKSELEHEGFSQQVLQKHKEVLRAYIRELQTMSNSNDGCSTIRGLLEHEAKSYPTSPKEVFHPIDNDKFPATMKNERRLPSSAPRGMPNQLPYEKRSFSSEDDVSDASDSLALISTNELIAMDTLNTGMAGMQLQAPSSQYRFSPTNTGPRYLPPNASGYLTGTPEGDLSTSPNSQMFGASPRFVPPFSSQTAGGLSPPPYGSSPRSFSRLAPDRYGQEIPVDAQWTKIKRTLVSPEVLERAGVRYEARPEYVAVLGCLSRDQIADFARQSADARAARSGRPPPSRRYERQERERADSKSSRDEDDDESVLWDESDSTDVDDDKLSDKGTKSYPYIVNPPEKGKDKASPSSTVQPKPILKNRNENHVRFDPQPHEVENKSPRSFKDDREHERERDRERRHERAPSTSRRHRRESSSRYSESADRYGPRSSNDRLGDSYSGSSRRHYRERGDRRGSRREDGRRDERAMKKKAWGETLGAVGIGGAAVSLLSVLAEAASAV